MTESQAPPAPQKPSVDAEPVENLAEEETRQESVPSQDRNPARRSSKISSPSEPASNTDRDVVPGDDVWDLPEVEAEVVVEKSGKDLPIPRVMWFIHSRPDGLELYVDGARAGGTPIGLKLTEGEHKFRVESQDGREETMTVEVSKVARQNKTILDLVP